MGRAIACMPLPPSSSYSDGSSPDRSDTGCRTTDETLARSARIEIFHTAGCSQPVRETLDSLPCKTHMIDRTENTAAEPSASAHPTEPTATAGDPQPSGYRAVLQNRNFLALWSGQVFSQLSDKVFLVLLVALIAPTFKLRENRWVVGSRPSWWPLPSPPFCLARWQGYMSIVGRPNG